jgi:magnesium transporter
MRKIASWAAIAAVPTVIAGNFGMNFAVMPGLSWRYGFSASVAVMAAAAVFLYRRFKKVGWL